MFPTRALGMQASRMMGMKPSPMLRMKPSPMMRMQPTRAMMRPMPKEEHGAHTISQRIRTLKKVPPELIPLGIVLAIAIGAAVYAMGRKLYTDKTLRRWRQGKTESKH